MRTFCKTCNKTTEQEYVGLEFYTRKIASRCIDCRHTNFHEEEWVSAKNRNKKAIKIPLKKMEEEKNKIFEYAKASKASCELEDGLETQFES